MRFAPPIGGLAAGTVELRADGCLTTTAAHHTAGLRRLTLATTRAVRRTAARLLTRVPSHASVACLRTPSLSNAAATHGRILLLACHTQLLCCLAIAHAGHPLAWRASHRALLHTRRTFARRRTLHSAPKRARRSFWLSPKEQEKNMELLHL